MAIIRLYPKINKESPFVFSIPDEVANRIGNYWRNEVIQVVPSSSNMGFVFRPDDYLLMEVTLEQKGDTAPSDPINED